jgi:hypothetical protein
MKKTVLTYGLIAGLIVSAVMVASMPFMEKVDGQWGMVIGYTTQLIAFALIFVAVKAYREKEGNGTITFGKAFQIGLYISLIASTMYVVCWMIEYHFFLPDFMEKFTAATLEKMKADGASAAEIAETTKQFADYGEIYKSPIKIFLFTYIEILPTGLLASLLAALILRKKPQTLAV